jgi:hypothetical protein
MTPEKSTHLDIFDAHTTLLGICGPGRIPQLFLSVKIGRRVLRGKRKVSSALDRPENDLTSPSLPQGFPLESSK